MLRPSTSAILALLLVVTGLAGCRLGTAFDGAAWRDEAQAREGVRRPMADRLLLTRALLEKSRAEVLAKLGPPTETGKFRQWDLVYWIGPERGYFSIDSEWLVLGLDSAGRVVEAQIATD